MFVVAVSRGASHFVVLLSKFMSIVVLSVVLNLIIFIWS